MGSLNDKGVVDYGAGVPLLPFEALGKIRARVTSYRTGIGQSAIDKSATFTVLASEADGIDVGEAYALWFKQGQDVKKQVFVDRELRNFVMAAVGADPADRNFDADGAEQVLKSMDFDDSETDVVIVQSPDSYTKDGVTRNVTRRRYFPAKG